MEDLEKSEAPIDFERLREVCSDDAEMIDEIVELYFSQTSEQMNDLKNAISAGNSEEIYKHAHKIVGGSMTCGMNAIVPSMRDLEQIGRGNQDAENAEKLFGQAQFAFGKMKEFLETNRKNLIS
jgi:HPt (histidine-containing phosphotransfer) domain-containing protein